MLGSLLSRALSNYMHKPNYIIVRPKAIWAGLICRIH